MVISCIVTLTPGASNVNLRYFFHTKSQIHITFFFSNFCVIFVIFWAFLVSYLIFVWFRHIFWLFTNFFCVRNTLTLFIIRSSFSYPTLFAHITFNCKSLNLGNVHKLQQILYLYISFSEKLKKKILFFFCFFLITSCNNNNNNKKKQSKSYRKKLLIDVFSVLY